MPKLLLSYLCLLTGVIGLVVPFVPGVLLLIVGVRLLGPDHWLAKRTMSLMTRLGLQR